MLLKKDDLAIVEKYLIPVGENKYRLKDIPRLDHINKKLRELDELQILCYGEHMIEDFEKNER